MPSQPQELLVRLYVWTCPPRVTQGVRVWTADADAFLEELRASAAKQFGADVASTMTIRPAPELCGPFYGVPFQHDGALFCYLYASTNSAVVARPGGTEREFVKWHHLPGYLREAGLYELHHVPWDYDGALAGEFNRYVQRMVARGVSGFSVSLGTDGGADTAALIRAYLRTDWAVNSGHTHAIHSLDGPKDWRDTWNRRVRAPLARLLRPNPYQPPAQRPAVARALYALARPRWRRFSILDAVGPLGGVFMSVLLPPGQYALVLAAAFAWGMLCGAVSSSLRRSHGQAA